MKPKPTSWPSAFQPLIKKYKGQRHPLEYKNIYQLLVMVVLSARDSDKHINKVAPEFFKTYPDMKSLSKAKEDVMLILTKGITNFVNKSQWLMEIGRLVKADKNIPLTMEGLTELPGIGRKSANVIMREAKAKAEGVMVDLHVVRVAPRLGIATGTNPLKIEAQIMAVLSQKDWGEAGMAMSFLGREICRPKEPKCLECVMNPVCEYFHSVMKPNLMKR